MMFCRLHERGAEDDRSFLRTEFLPPWQPYRFYKSGRKREFGATLFNFSATFGHGCQESGNTMKIGDLEFCRVHLISDNHTNLHVPKSSWSVPFKPRVLLRLPFSNHFF
ncbi:hypothetical protein HanOQP8_Chr07g0242671 [Helianthus annuus]|nr:hypothetical protein HanOQP8_Chr07g0242671 [Helianthus annuus]